MFFLLFPIYFLQCIQVQVPKKTSQAMHFSGWKLIPRGWFHTVYENLSESCIKEYETFPNWEQVHSANSVTKKPGLLGLREIEAKK